MKESALEVESQLLWPGHPQPYAGELFSSWVARVAYANGMNCQQLFAVTFPKATLTCDLDVRPKDFIVNEFARRTGVTRKALWKLTFSAWAGVVGRPLGRSAGTPWVLSVPVGDPDRQALPCCPLCIVEEPYFRKIWRLAFVTVCAWHGTRLVDRCSSCSGSLGVTRNRLSTGQTIDASFLARCTRCGVERRNGGATADYAVLRLQRWLTRAFSGSALEERRTAFFVGLRMLVDIMEARWEPERYSGHHVTEPTATHGPRLETSRLSIRYEVIKRLARLFEEARDNLVEACLTLGMVAVSLNVNSMRMPSRCLYALLWLHKEVLRNRLSHHELRAKVTEKTLDRDNLPLALAAFANRTEFFLDASECGGTKHTPLCAPPVWESIVV